MVGIKAMINTRIRVKTVVGIKTRVCIINAGVLTKANTAKVRIANAGYSNVTRIGGRTNTTSDSIAKARMRVVSNTKAQVKAKVRITNAGYSTTNMVGIKGWIEIGIKALVGA